MLVDGFQSPAVSLADVQLLAQAADVRVDGARIQVRAAAPDGFKNVPA